MISDKEVIVEISSCIDAACTGWLVDSISGKYYVRCRDPKHNLAEESDRNTKNEAGDQPASADGNNHTQPAKSGVKCYDSK
jgi:hypothetical protein